MKSVAFVPIKLNSERLPGKNIKSFTNGERHAGCIIMWLLHVNIIMKGKSRWAKKLLSLITWK